MPCQRPILAGILGLALAGAVTTAEQVAQPPASAGTSLILGRVVDDSTNQGIAGVIVTIGGATPTLPPVGELLEPRLPGLPTGPTSRRTLTATDGRFLFRDLPKGTYTIATTAQAYVNGAYGQGRPMGPGQAIELGDNQRIGSVTIRVWKFGSISGRILDENGDPAVAVNMRCLRRVISGGQRRLSTTGLSSLLMTDDRGIYRVPNLPPGEYICGIPISQSTTPLAVVDAVDAANQSGNPNGSDAYRSLQNSGGAVFTASGTRVGDLVFSPGASVTRGLAPPPSDATRRAMTYATQYYPSATTTRQATAITLKAGEERTGVDLQLRLLPAVRVSGRVVGPNGPAPFLAITLVPATGTDFVSEGQADVAGTVSDPAGAFTMLSIPPGQYVIKVRMYPRPVPGSGTPESILDVPSLWAAMPITIGDSDVPDLVLALQPGIRLTGRVEFVGSRTQPTPAEIQRMGIRLQSAEGRTSSPIPSDGRVTPDLNFRTTGYPAGKYIVSLLQTTLPAGWFVKSVTAGGKDISVEPIELSGANITGVVITLTDRITTLSGTVTDASGPDPNAAVIVFPADSIAWKEIGVPARRGRYERVSKAGTFATTGLPAGDYFVVAVSHASAGDPQDPAFLDVLSKTATRVTLADGASASVQLTVRAK